MPKRIALIMGEDDYLAVSQTPSPNGVFEWEWFDLARRDLEQYLRTTDVDAVAVIKAP